ncbi:MAG: murein biosynthesis integral membrane protein MurJ [candidate division Zixibacteria bacterium]|nr:murein biosynthesis integral membrane protein MurJ [candidate division Zixibacteria bacterium]
MSTGNSQKDSLFKSAGIVSSATAVSRVLGLVREQVMAFFFGAGMATDAFVTAFRIPNLLRDMFAEGALSSAFIPVFKEKLVKGDKQEAFTLANIVLTAILLVVGAIVLFGIIATPIIIYISAHGFTANPQKFDLTVSLTRLMFVYLLLVSVSALIMGMLNSFGKFGIPAISPAVFNLGIILANVLLYEYLNVPVYALAIGVLIGGIGQAAIQLPALIKIGYRFKPDFNFIDDSFKKVIRLFVPMIIGLSAGRVNILVSTLLASFLVEGAITYLNYSFRLMHFPLGVFAVALGTVALPKASEIAAKGDMEGLRDTFYQALNLNMLFILPSAFILADWGYEIVGLIYQWGRFTELDAQNTGLTLLHYSYGLVGFAAVRVTVPVYYALGDSKLPMKISIFSIVLNIILYFPLIKILSFAGLAAATSIAALINFGLLLYFMPRKGLQISYHKLFLNILRIALAAFLAMYVSKLITFDFSRSAPAVLDRFLNLAIPVTGGVIIYMVFCLIFRVKEFTLLARKLFRGNKTI